LTEFDGQTKISELHNNSTIIIFLNKSQTGGC
jgi:hypothetical protein